MSRDVVKVFCPKNHRIGTVKADADGLFLEYIAEGLHLGGAIFGAPNTLRLPYEEVAVFAGYCKSCSSSVSLNAPVLRAAALNNAPGIQAPFAITADLEWADAGRDRIYPPDLEWLKDDPRSSDD